MPLRWVPPARKVPRVAGSRAGLDRKPALIAQSEEPPAAPSQIPPATRPGHMQSGMGQARQAEAESRAPSRAFSSTGSLDLWLLLWPWALRSPRLERLSATAATWGQQWSSADGGARGNPPANRPPAQRFANGLRDPWRASAR